MRKSPQRSSATRTSSGEGDAAAVNGRLREYNCGPFTVMSDRKYRQRGYQDDDRDRPPRPATPRQAPEPGAPAGARRLSQDGPRTINMPGFREVVRCAQCGTIVTAEVALDSRCLRCGTDLHACAQCRSFDPGSPLECMQAIPARVSPKNARNTCSLYAPRATVERETTTPKVDTARKAFDDLFNF
jgi:hypothetical protein